MKWMLVMFCLNKECSLWHIEGIFLSEIILCIVVSLAQAPLFADCQWTHTRSSGLTSPNGGAFFLVSVSVVLLGNETAKAAARSAVFLWGLSSELLYSNVCVFFTL
jgi:hypothetical protein